MYQDDGQDNVNYYLGLEDVVTLITHNIED